MVQNPFYVAGPVPSECFVGRSREIKIAFDQISKRAHSAFYGGSGTGKSSFLKLLTEATTWQARGLDFSQVHIISLNCTDVNPFSASNFFREILELLQDQVDEQADLLSAIETVLAEDVVERSDLRRIVRKVGQGNKFLLLVLDDFDWMLRQSENYTEAAMLTFLNEFRNLCVYTTESQYLSTVITSFRPIPELGPTLTPNGSPWYNHYLCHALRPFSQTEIEQHFFTVDQALFIPLVPKVKEAVLQLAGGNPALLQQAFSLLHDTMQAERSLDKINVKEFAEQFVGRTEHFFRDTWRFSTDKEQVLLMLIALRCREGRVSQQSQYSLKDIDLILSQRSWELSDLEERGIIRKLEKDDKVVHKFSSSLMEWWVIQEIQNSDEDEIERREKVFLNWMSREQADRLKTVLRQVWQQKEAIKGAIEWTVSLFGKALKG
jgi:hypothetical protein